MTQLTCVGLAPPSPESLPRLVALFFSVFDNTSGPQLQYQVPEDSVSKRRKPGEEASISTAGDTEEEKKDGYDLFDLIASDYAIPREDLCGHLVTICTKRHKVLGCPIALASPLYPRNIFLFNVAFVFDRDAELAAYEPLVRKTARVLRSLEVHAFCFLRPPHPLNLIKCTYRPGKHQSLVQSRSQTFHELCA